MRYAAKMENNDSSIQVALFRSNSLVSRLIRWQTRGFYNHAALVWRGQVIEAREFEGVVTRKASTLQAEPLVHLYASGCDEETSRRIWSFALARLGYKYDYRMVTRFVSRLPANEAQQEKWFCSELVFAAFREGGVCLLENIEPWAVSPSMLSLSPLLKREV